MLFQFWVLVFPKSFNKALEESKIVQSIGQFFINIIDGIDNLFEGAKTIFWGIMMILWVLAIMSVLSY